ncbi:MAG: phosphoribosylformylglycinamidine cyclo-ligase, partial [Oscillospiraceae bacterium]
LKLAFVMDRHDTIGIDCVAMCVNDVVTCGARPLFFLDYIACGKNVPERIAAIVSGVADGCVASGASLIGGETAEMPGFYAESEYDLAGFAVGVVDRNKMLNNQEMRAGDVIVALASSGPHSNGFSLIRSAFDIEHAELGMRVSELGTTLGEALLAPTRIYVKSVLALLESVRASALAHITGGGFYENIPRALPDGLCARIERAAVKTPPVFEIISRAGDIPERDMFGTFNMGVGMMAVVHPDDADRAVAILKENGEDAYVIGKIASGERGVEIC